MECLIYLEKASYEPYFSNWNRRSGGYPAANSNNFMGGTETSLQTLAIFISSVDRFQSLFVSQATCAQEIFFNQEHTFSGRPVALSSSVKYQAPSLCPP